MSTLTSLQFTFTHNIGRLICWAYEAGYELTLGEAFRTPQQAQWNADHGCGIKNSLHTQRLAVDFNLFHDGIYLPLSADHDAMGTYWKSLHPLNRWGGDFPKPDGGHYSMQCGGVQ